MNRKKWMTAAFGAAAVVTFVERADAEEFRSCAEVVTRGNVVECAVRAGLALRAEKQEREVLEGRRTAVGALLPSNPVVSVLAACRTAPIGDVSAFNWYASVSQELEIAGQRGLRREVVEASLRAQDKRIVVARRQAALDAWRAFFEASSAQYEQQLAENLTHLARSVAAVARAKADDGILAPLDADIAEATSLRLDATRFQAERRVRQTRAALATLLGLDARVEIAIEADLSPVPGTETFAHAPTERAPTHRPELEAADADRRAQELRANAYRRARIPNPSLSFFVQNDGFNERVIGGGLALPIPLPAPVGRTYAGEIAETEASARRTETERERLARDIRLDIASAVTAFESRQRELAAFTPERLRRTEERLRLLGEEIRSGRLNVREALLAQQAFVELMQAHLTARRELAFASVDLARAGGIAVEGGAR